MEEKYKSNLGIYSADNKKEKAWARIVSAVLHPFLMTTYAVALLFVYTDFRYILTNHFSGIILRVIFFSCIIPLLSIYFYKKGGFISSLSLDKKGERLLPLLTIFLSYSLLFFAFYMGELYTWFLGLLFVPIVLLAMCSLISNYWRISVYMVGIGALLGSVLSVAYNIKLQNPYDIFIILIILAGILGASRLALNKNTPAQVYVGFLLGLVVSYLTIFIAWYFPILYILYSN